MNKMPNITNHFLKHYKTKENNEDGFSLLELVVAIGILLVLTVGGLIGYSGITDNARTAAAESAASEISTGIIVALSDNIDTNNAPREGDDGGWIPKYRSMFPDMTININPDDTANAPEYTITVTHKKQKAPTDSIVKVVKP